MKIGIPKSLLYYKYKHLWNSFFSYFKEVELIYSEDTNKEIVKTGINYSIDESCLSSKIYMGHIHNLIGKCDYILVPRIVTLSKHFEVCTKFNALADIVKTTFPGIKIITYDVDVKRGKLEKQAFIKMGRKLGLNWECLSDAYDYAKDIELKALKSKIKTQEKLLNRDELKVLIVGHSYNVDDEYIGGSIINYLRELDVIPIFADAVLEKEALKKSENISKSLYWIYNKELLGGIERYKEQVDGIILLSSFPCGPDSLVNDLVMRKIKDKPILYLVIDELEGTAGIETRIESFVDILKRRVKNG